MIMFQVENKRQLMAAIRAGVGVDEVVIMMTDAPTVYKFPRGLTEKRALEICRNIRRTPAAVFRSET